MSTWLDLDKTDDESLSSDFEDDLDFHADSKPAQQAATNNVNVNNDNGTKTQLTFESDTTGQSQTPSTLPTATDSNLSTSSETTASSDTQQSTTSTIEPTLRPQPFLSTLSPAHAAMPPLHVTRPGRGFNKYDLGLRGHRKSKSMGLLSTAFRPPLPGSGLSAAKTKLLRSDLLMDNSHSPNHNHNHNHKLPRSPVRHDADNNTPQDGPLKRSYSYPVPDTEPFCVWLGNLPAEAAPCDIVAYLEPLGIEPKDIRFGRIHKNKYTCAYVDFHSQDDMKTALRSIDCTTAPLFMGRQVEIDINEGIVVDREAAVTCTSSASSLNSGFRPKGKRNNNVDNNVKMNNINAAHSNEEAAKAANANNQDVRFSRDKKNNARQVANVEDSKSREKEMINGNTHSNNGFNQGDYYSDKRDRYNRSKDLRGRGRGRGRARGRGGRGRGGENSVARNAGYWSGQWGQYRRKNGKPDHGGTFGARNQSHMNGGGQPPPFMSPPNGNAVNLNNANNSNSPNKPVKILQRPKQSQAAMMSAGAQPLQPNNNQLQMNGGHLVHQSSQGSSIHDEENNYAKQRKSRFPTLDEDESEHRSSSNLNPTVQDYIHNEAMNMNNMRRNPHYNSNNLNNNNSNGSNGGNNNNMMSNNNMNTGYHDNAASYHDRKYYGKSKRHINNSSFNNMQAASQPYAPHNSYKGKRHRNAHRDRVENYYTSKAGYKGINRRSNYNDNHSSGSSSSYRSGPSNRYSKKRHNSYGY